MLSLASPCAVRCHNFGKRYEVDAICSRSFFFVSFVAVLILLSQQPARGQQQTAVTDGVMIESLTHYSFSPPDTEHTGSSQVVLINILKPDASDLSGQSSTVVNASENVEPETVVGGNRALDPSGFSSLLDGVFGASFR